MERIASISTDIPLLTHQGTPLSITLLLGSSPGKSSSLRLGSQSLLLLPILAAEEGNSRNTTDNTTAKDNCDNNARDAGVVYEVHADVITLAVHGARLPRGAAGTRGHGGVARRGADSVTDGLKVAVCGGDGLGGEAGLARIGGAREDVHVVKEDCLAKVGGGGDSGQAVIMGSDGSSEGARGEEEG